MPDTQVQTPNAPDAVHTNSAQRQQNLNVVLFKYGYITHNCSLVNLGWVSQQLATIKSCLCKDTFCKRPHDTLPVTKQSFQPPTKGRVRSGCSLLRGRAKLVLRRARIPNGFSALGIKY